MAGNLQPQGARKLAGLVRVDRALAPVRGVDQRTRAFEVIGRLPAYTTVTGFVVTPVVALVRPGFTLALDSFEVAEAFEVPLDFLMDPANHRQHLLDLGGRELSYFSMPWAPLQPRDTDYFIWGATAAMLRNFYRFLSA